MPPRLRPSARQKQTRELPPRKRGQGQPAALQHLRTRPARLAPLRPHPRPRRHEEGPPVVQHGKGQAGWEQQEGRPPHPRQQLRRRPRQAGAHRPQALAAWQTVVQQTGPCGRASVTRERDRLQWRDTRKQQMGAVRRRSVSVRLPCAGLHVSPEGRGALPGSEPAGLSSPEQSQDFLPDQSQGFPGPGSEPAWTTAPPRW